MKQFLRWLWNYYHPPKKIPASGLFTYGKKYKLELQGTQLEVRITESFPGFHRVEYLSSVCVTPYYSDKNIRGCPPIVDADDVKVLTWREEGVIKPPAIIEEEIPPEKERNIKLE